MITPPPRHLSLKDKLAYGLGDFASNLIWATTLTYIVYFYTDIYRIPAALVAGILLVCRIANAVIDPVIGMAIDRRHPSGERARPFLKWGAVPLALSTVLVFVPLGDTVVVKVIWAVVTFLLLSITYSFVNTAYGMLTNLMTVATRERLQLTSARLIGANIGSTFIGWITLPAVALLGAGQPRQGFMLFMGMVGVAAGGFFLITYRYCHENVRIAVPADSPHVRTSRSATVAALLANRPWMVLTIIKFLNSTANTLSLGSITYAALYLNHMGASFGGSMIATITASSFAGCWLAPWLVGRIGSRGAVRLTNCSQAALFVVLALAPASPPVLLTILAGIGVMIGMRDPVTYAMLSDTLDYGRARSGVDAMGLGYSIASAAYKIAAGVGGASLALLLANSGYVAGASDQSAGALFAIRLGFAILPAGLLGLSALMTIAYPADSEIERGRRAGQS